MPAGLVNLPNLHTRNRASAVLVSRDSFPTMQRLDFSIIDGKGQPLHEPGFVESDTDLPVAVMEAVNDYLESLGAQRIGTSSATSVRFKTAPLRKSAPRAV